MLQRAGDLWVPYISGHVKGGINWKARWMCEMCVRRW
jgi:hypothetical protein